MNQVEAAEKFITWLEKQLSQAGRGDNAGELSVEPSGKFWSGRIASESMIADSGLGDRGERLEPCAIGVRVRPATKGAWKFSVSLSFVVWLKINDKWQKSEKYTKAVEVEFPADGVEQSYAEDDIRKDIGKICGTEGFSAKILVEREVHAGRDELIIQLVNTSPKEHKIFKDTRIYEASLEVNGIQLSPFMMESLPDSFRFDRRVWGYGINSGIEVEGQVKIKTVDSVSASKMRPKFWPADFPSQSFEFQSIAADPVGISEKLLAALKQWGVNNWSEDALTARAKKDHWTSEMLAEARQEAKKYNEEVRRIEDGKTYLIKDKNLNTAFCLMNRAMNIAAAGKFNSWRPFQFGFLLANLRSIVDPLNEESTVDIVWFATGGGKTETYLGLLITATLFDRLRGKKSGITAWSRFPLRMLSLQQTQRFANALAAAEIVRREASIHGAPFSMGFFVGQDATPNTIKKEPKENDKWDSSDVEMPKRLRVLELCPFCRNDSIEMGFNRKFWRLEHRCKNTECPWPEDALPFYIVDDEIYRFLPTVIVGTLDKAASIAMQASMRGFIGAPWGICPKEGHGYTYAPRSNRPSGCLVPDCSAASSPLPQTKELYGPTFRLQDELHLLRDSLGAVDAHYEAVFDGLQTELCGFRAKILASSATLMGYEKQCSVLYRRDARVFPLQGPTTSEGFWNSDSAELMRKYVAVAPRGVTIEYTVDRLLTELQKCIRTLQKDPKAVCAEAGIPEHHADFLVSYYGTNVVYGNTLKDLDAVVRSSETQVIVDGVINTDSLTGRTAFEDVRKILKRLEHPEDNFFDRLHLISASSMMSHGVDIDRLNIMIMLGLPLGAAEFIQATARVGRKYPGIVFVIHKIGRERDASVFRSFGKFVEQGDRFVESIPVTRKSRRVLERTIAGMEQARLLAIHEPQSKIALTTVKSIREFVQSGKFSSQQEADALFQYLGLAGELDEMMKEDIRKWMKNLLRNIQDPPSDAKFYGHLSPTGEPMMSLRDVEEQVPVYGSQIK